MADYKSWWPLGRRFINTRRYITTKDTEDAKNEFSFVSVVSLVVD